MARRRDGTRSRTGRPAARPPVVREFSAGGLVYRRRDGQWLVVLAGRRPTADGPIVWGLPKGHVEPGEHMVDAAVREVREETGLVATIEETLGDVTYWYVRRDEHGAPVRAFKRVRFYLMRHRSGRFADRDQELDAVRWVPLAKAEGMIAFENERGLVRRAGELLDAAPPTP
jgi:8-oxo-dGTP pyrophosphatase MutT (NUDIX family)